MASTLTSDPVRDFQMRALESARDFQTAEEIQLETWGCGERDVVSASIFSVARNFGGQSLGAMDGKRIVGFVLSFGAIEDGHACFHSHMVGVAHDYKNRGLGRRIKLAQREDALSRASIRSFGPSILCRSETLTSTLCGSTVSAFGIFPTSMEKPAALCTEACQLADW